MGGSRPPYDVDGHSTRDVNLGATESFGAVETSSPWFLKQWVLALWGLAVLLLIATIVYGLIILATGNGGDAPATTRSSTTTPSSTAPARTTTPSSTLPTTTVPPPETTTTPETAPPVSNLDAAATSPSSLVERQRASDTRATPDSRPGLQPVDDWVSRWPACRSKVRAAFAAVNARKM